MEIEDKLVSDMKESMKSGEKLRLTTIRMVLAGMKNERIAKGEDLSEEDVLTVLGREARKRREAIVEYDKAGRDELAAKEREELTVIEGYLPEQMSEEEIEGIVREAIADTGASSGKDMGKVMGKVMPRVKGKADGRLVNETVLKLLAE
ncbi:MAG: GatB/YqeY domain-containing protein [Actinobacteria bacterium]|nr:GatB/YqeY domain-containing protein [Actinomycetota bacterium]